MRASLLFIFLVYGEFGLIVNRALVNGEAAAFLSTSFHQRRQIQSTTCKERSDKILRLI